MLIGVGTSSLVAYSRQMFIYSFILCAKLHLHHNAGNSRNAIKRQKKEKKTKCQKLTMTAISVTMIMMMPRKRI